jgi:hypothetical protein
LADINDDAGMQSRSGGKHPELDKHLPEGILAIFVVLFFEALWRAVEFDSSDALESSRGQDSDWMVLRPCLKNGSGVNPRAA